MLDSKHPLFVVGNMIDGACFENAFAPLFCTGNGRPPKPIRLMTGLLILKHLRNVSDELVVVPFSENAYYQHFCGMISKGKEHKKYEFGNKASIVRFWNGIIIGALSFRNEHDGHRTDKSLEQVGRVYGRKIKVIAGDSGVWRTADVRRNGDSHTKCSETV